MSRPWDHGETGVPVPTVSFTGSDGTIAELLYDPQVQTTALALCRPGESPCVVDRFEAEGKVHVPYGASNNLIATRCVLLPSGVEEFPGKNNLLRDLHEYLARYVDMSSTFGEIAVHYVLLSWVYDAFNELPYLRFRGDYGTGKTRALLAVGSVCYKPFFASGASTVSPIFHVLDAFRGTMVLDEADLRFSDATADLTKILNNGNVRGLPVLRTMTNRYRELNPQAFRVYGPKLLAMRESFADPALESRFLTEEMGQRPLPGGIPIQLPDSLEREAQILRNQLLAWRFHARHTVGSDPSRLMEGVEPRLNQIGLPLLSLMDNADGRARVRRELVGQEARVLNERASTLEATMLGVIVEAFAETARTHIPVSELTRRLNLQAEDQLYAPMSAKQVGSIVRNKLRLSTTKTGGIYVIPQTERARIEALAQRYRIGEGQLRRDRRRED